MFVAVAAADNVIKPPPLKLIATPEALATAATDRVTEVLELIAVTYVPATIPVPETYIPISTPVVEPRVSNVVEVWVEPVVLRLKVPLVTETTVVLAGMPVPVITWPGCTPSKIGDDVPSPLIDRMVVDVFVRFPRKLVSE